jgi:hypothetical protein
MATLLSDDFNRANSTSVIGAPQIGPSPVVQTGIGGINSNQLYGPTSVMVATYDLGTPNVEISFLASNVSGPVDGAVLGYVSSTDYYYVGFQGTSPVVLNKVTTGGTVALYSSSVRQPTSSTSVCKAHYRDGIIRAYVDDVLVLRWVLDTPITANLHGVRLSTSTGRLDNLLGTDAPTISEPILDGAKPDVAFVYTEATADIPPSFVYLGRDTKLQDITEGA